jgi:putative oxidoreductase
MNQLAPYAAFFMRLAVGGVFLSHGIDKFQRGVPAVAANLHGFHLPFASVLAVYLIAVETVGAVCVMIGFYTRLWAAAMAVNMLAAIFLVILPHGGSFELEGLLFAGAVTLVALGDGPLSIAVRFKKAPFSG